MSVTLAELRNRTLEDMGVIEIGGIPDDRYKTRVDQAYNEVYDDLKDQSLNFWSNIGEIPNRFVPYVSALIIENLKVGIPISQERYARVFPTIQKAKFKISELGSQKYETTSKPVYY